MSRMIVLVSSYKEGGLLRTCVNSAKPAGHVYVFEGPVGDAPESTSHDVVGCTADYVTLGRWHDDADKRTQMLHYAQKRYAAQNSPDPLWLLWLDGDEILLWGEYLVDWTRRAEYETGAGGFKIRLVELDGSVVQSHGRVVRGDLIEQYEHSIATILLKSGMIVSLPNVPICAAGGVPIWNDASRKIEVDDMAVLRPPLSGEPHILHRTILRDPSRKEFAERQHEAEARFFVENT